MFGLVSIIRIQICEHYIGSDMRTLYKVRIANLSTYYVLITSCSYAGGSAIKSESGLDLVPRSGTLVRSAALLRV